MSSADAGRRRRWPSWLAGIMIPVALSACATRDRPECAAGTPALVFRLYFGRSIPGRAELTEPEWQAFLADTVTPAFPAGYTVLEAEGAWTSPRSHRTIREHTNVLVVALPVRSESWTTVNQVRASYQAKFHQQLVGLIASEGCADF